MKDNEMICELFSFLGVVWTVDVKSNKLYYKCVKHKPNEDEQLMIAEAFKKMKFKTKDIIFVERIIDYEKKE